MATPLPPLNPNQTGKICPMMDIDPIKNKYEGVESNSGVM